MSATIASMLVSIGADITEFEKSLEDASKSMEKLGKRLTDIGKDLSLYVTAPLAGIGAAAIKMAADMEQSRIAFTTLLGSAEKAGKFLSELADFASKTPFEFVGLQETAKRLMALGFEAKDVIPVMTAVGDAVAGLGGGQEKIDRVTLALGQMKAKGKVSAQEMNQLAEAGIPGWDMLAKKIGVSIPEAMKLAEQGAISSAGAIPAILEGMNEKFGGLMDKQSKTFWGVWSNLKDSITLLLVDIGNSIMETFDLKDVLSSVLDFVNSFKAWWAELSPPVKDSIIIIAGLAAAFGPLMVTIGSVIKVFGLLSKTLSTVLNMNPYVLAIGALIAAGVMLYKHWDEVVHYASVAWNNIKLGTLTAIEAVLKGYEKFLGWIPGLGSALDKAIGYVENLKDETKKHMKESQKAWEDHLKKPVEDAGETIESATKKATKSVVEIAGKFKDHSADIEVLSRQLKNAGFVLEDYTKDLKDWKKPGEDQEKILDRLQKALGKHNEELGRSVRAQNLLQGETGAMIQTLENAGFNVDDLKEKIITLSDSIDNQASFVLAVNKRWGEYQEYLGKSIVSSNDFNTTMFELNNQLELADKLHQTLGSDFDATRAKTDLIRKAIEDFTKSGKASEEQILALKNQLQTLKIEGAFAVQGFSDFAINEFIEVKKAIEDNLSSALADAIMGEDVDWEKLWKEGMLKMILEDLIKYLIQVAIAATGVKAAIASIFGVDVAAGAAGGAAAGTAAGAAAGTGATAAGTGAGAGAAAGGSSLWSIAAIAALVYGIEQSGAIDTISKGWNEFINEFLKDPVQWLDERWNLEEFEKKSGIPGLDDDLNSLGDIADWLGFAHGGIVTGPTRAIIGEAGPEAVIPLDRLDDFMGGGSQTIIIDLDGRTIAKRTVQHMPSVLRLQGVPV